MPKIEKYVCYIFTENICSARNPMQVVVFCRHVLICFLQQQLKFSYFKGSIIPQIYKTLTNEQECILMTFPI